MAEPGFGAVGGGTLRSTAGSVFAGLAGWGREGGVGVEAATEGAAVVVIAGCGVFVGRMGTVAATGFWGSAFERVTIRITLGTGGAGAPTAGGGLSVTET
jgi:hypothetical protein